MSGSSVVFSDGRSMTLAALALATVVSLPACTRAGNSATTGDSGVSHDGGSAATGDACPGTNEPACYPTPLPLDASHEMIINACTDAEAFDKSPNLPLLGPCGKLPPLP
jgi:hypothetical protein